MPRKNLALLAGRPLLSYTFDAVRGSRCLTRPVLSTDDVEIAAYARSCGVEVPFMRPAALADDTTSALPVVQHALAELGRSGFLPDVVVLLQPTSPLRRAARIDAAVEKFVASGADSVVTVVEVPHQFNPVSVVKIEEGRLVPFFDRTGDDGSPQAGQTARVCAQWGRRLCDQAPDNHRWKSVWSRLSTSRNERRRVDRHRRT